MNSSLIEKIKKLLRLGKDKGATAAEASSALAKAQQLAAEHGISLSEIGEADEETGVLTHISVPSLKGLPHRLASGLIKRHFGVDTLFDSTGAKAVMHIIGTPSQAQLAEYVYIYLVRALRQSWQQRENRRLKNREAFLRGFSHAISRQLPEVFPQTGLILSHQSYIEDRLLNPGEKLTSLPVSKKPLSEAAFSHGLRAGRQAGIRNAIRGSETLSLN